MKRRRGEAADAEGVPPDCRSDAREAEEAFAGSGKAVVEVSAAGGKLGISCRTSCSMGGRIGSKDPARGSTPVSGTHLPLLKGQQEILDRGVAATALAVFHLEPAQVRRQGAT